MRKRLSWLTVLVILGLAMTPQASNAQQALYGQQQEGGQGGGLDVPPPTTIFPGFIGGNRLSQGGWYIAGEYMFWKQSNPMKSEPLGFRGIQDTDGSIGAALGLGNMPGQWIGSKAVALDTNYVSGPSSYAPGFSVALGYRFESGLAVETSWIHLTDLRYSATASLLPPTQIGANAEETFISSPVYNFSPSYFGPGNTATNAAGSLVGSPIAMFGIWDGSSLQTITFVQRFDEWELAARMPLTETDNWRTYGILGPRLVSMWERFTWNVVHPEANGSVSAQDSAQYTNTVSNRLYGVHAGIGNEWLLGDTPCGAFSISVDTQCALFVDFAKGLPRYELGDESTAATHNRGFANLVPELDGQVNLWWYPYHGIVCRIGFQAMAFFNTVSSPRPVDFNFGSITPAFESTFRLFDGINAGVGFIF